MDWCREEFKFYHEQAKKYEELKSVHSHEFNGLLAETDEIQQKYAQLHWNKVRLLIFYNLYGMVYLKYTDNKSYLLYLLYCDYLQFPQYPTGHLKHLQSWIDAERNLIKFYHEQAKKWEELKFVHSHDFDGLLAETDEIQLKYAQLH